MKRAKASINTYISAIEKIRCDAAMRNVLTEGDSKIEQMEESEYRRLIEEEKTSYKNAFKRLKDLKAVIEQSKGLLKKSRVKLQTDFDKWYKVMCDRTFTFGERITESTQVNIDEVKEDASEVMPDISQGRNFQSQTGALSSEGISNLLKKTTGRHPSEEATFQLPPGARLTGNKEADDDIVAFYKAKEALMARTRNRASQIK